MRKIIDTTAPPPELLHAAGIESAKAVVVAIDDRSRALEMVEHIRRHYPEVKILARAFDVNHLYLLNKAGADIAVREVFDSSLELGKATLKAVGMHPFKVEKMSLAFRKHDEYGMNTLYELWGENTEMASNKAYLVRAREHGETLKEMMEQTACSCMIVRKEAGHRHPNTTLKTWATDDRSLLPPHSRMRYSG